MILSDKDPTETVTVTFDFSDLADAVSSPSVEASVICGVGDDSPGYILSGSPSVSAAMVMQAVTGGVAGTMYELRCTAFAGSEKFVLTAALPVRMQRAC